MLPIDCSSSVILLVSSPSQYSISVMVERWSLCVSVCERDCRWGIESELLEGPCIIMLLEWEGDRAAEDWGTVAGS